MGRKEMRKRYFDNWRLECNCFVKELEKMAEVRSKGAKPSPLKLDFDGE